MGRLSRFAQALTLLPVGGCFGLSQLPAMGFLGGPQEVSADFLGGQLGRFG